MVEFGHHAAADWWKDSGILEREWRMEMNLGTSWFSDHIPIETVSDGFWLPGIPGIYEKKILQGIYTPWSHQATLSFFKTQGVPAIHFLG